MDEESIQQLYSWIDEIVLSRPKRNITRDFSDGVLAAEIVAHYMPSMVELHNYTPANSSQQKRNNWETLNRKIFKRIDFNVPSNIINGIVLCKAGVIEIVLFNLRVKILNYMKSQEESESDAATIAEAEPWNAQNQSYANQNMMSGQGAIGSPNMATGAPNMATGVPNMAMGAPNMAMGVPNMAMGAPNMATGAPGMASYPPMRMYPTHPIAAPSQASVNPVYKKNQSNGAMATIPFEGEQVKKKKNPKKKKVPSKTAGQERSRSMPNSFTHLDRESQIYIQEKEQALMQSHETIQILQAKINRLEHLLQLKDLRIEDLDMKLKAATGRH